MYAALASANRDDRQFRSPDLLDLARGLEMVLGTFSGTRHRRGKRSSVVEHSRCRLATGWRGHLALRGCDIAPIVVHASEAASGVSFVFAGLPCTIFSKSLESEKDSALLV